MSKKFSNVPEAIQSSELEKSIRENRSIKLQVHDARESVRRMFRAKFRCSAIVVQPLVDSHAIDFRLVRQRTSEAFIVC